MRYLLLIAGLISSPAIAQVTVVDATTSTAKGGDARIVATVASPTPDAITGGSSPVAKGVMAHTVKRTGAMVRAGIPIGIAPRRLSVHGYHVMAMGLTQPLKVGDTFPLTLTFANAKPVTTTVRVVAR